MITCKTFDLKDHTDELATIAVVMECLARNDLEGAKALLILRQEKLMADPVLVDYMVAA